MPKPTVAVTGNTITVTDGKRTRQAICASPGAAKMLATRFKNDPSYMVRWLKTTVAVQLELPLPEPTP